jgi:predicted  nucleic acid-binding Zn-ribbon protein
MNRCHVLTMAVTLCGMFCGGAFAAEATTRPATMPVVAPATAGSAGTSSDVWDRRFQTNNPPGYPRRYYGPYEGTVENPADVAQRASCVLQIDGDQDLMNGNGSRMDPTTVASIANSTALTVPAVDAILDMPVEQRRQRVIVNAYATGARFLRLEVLIRKGDAAVKPTAAEDVLARIIERTKAAVAQSSDATGKQIAARTQELNQRITATQKQLAAVHAQIRQYRDQNAGFGNNYGDPRDNIANIQRQRQSAESELMRNVARLKALQPDTTAKTALVSEWEQVVSLQQQQLDALRAKVASGQGKASDVSDQEVKLAEAKAQLATAKQQQAAANTDSNRNYRNNEVPMLQSNIAEEQARIKSFDDQLAKLKDPKFQELAEQYPQLQQQEQQLNNSMVSLRNRLQQYDQTTSVSGPVTITVLDGTPAASMR